MPGLTGRLAAILALLALLSLAGCAGSEFEDEDEGSRPSAELLDDLRDYSDRKPIYWLGDSFEGLEISGAELGEEGAWVSYGQRSCDPGSGCHAFPVVVATASGWPDPYVPPASRRNTCFERVRGAVLLQDCRNHKHPATQWADLYTGPPPEYPYWPATRVTLSVAGPVGGGYETSAEDLARRIYPIHARSSAPQTLPVPKPVPCPHLEYLVRWWVEANVREFGANENCTLPELLGLP